MGVVTAFRDEGRDTVTVSGSAMRFSFVTWDGVDGIDFRVGCTSKLTFRLKYRGEYISPRRIALGYQGTAPGNPFAAHRR